MKIMIKVVMILMIADGGDDEYMKIAIKGVLHPWALFLKTLCIFSKNKATSDKVSYGSEQKCSKELKKSQFYFSRDHCCEVTVTNVRKSIFSMF